MLRIEKKRCSSYTVPAAKQIDSLVLPLFGHSNISAVFDGRLDNVGRVFLRIGQRLVGSAIRRNSPLSVNVSQK